MLRHALPLALLLALTAAAGAQEQPDPWSGIVLVITPAPVPEGGSAYDAAIAEADAHAADALPAGPDERGTEATPVVVADAPEDDTPPSLFAVLDLGLGDVDSLPETAPAPKRIVTVKPGVAAQASVLPTRLDLSEGPARIDLSSTVVTTAPLSAPIDARNGGGSGEIKGKVAFEGEGLTVYGVGKLGAAEATGTVSVYDSLIIGGAYSVPLGTLAGDRFGARVEIADTSAVTTAIEYRVKQAGTESFLSVEHAATSESGSGAVKAGLARKF